MCVPAGHGKSVAARPPDVASVTLRKVTLRLIPFLFVLYIVALPFTHAFLTRGFAPTTESIVFAGVGVTLAVGCMLPRWFVGVGVSRLFRLAIPVRPFRKQAPRLAPVAAPAGHSGLPSKAPTR